MNKVSATEHLNNILTLLKSDNPANHQSAVSIWTKHERQQHLLENEKYHDIQHEILSSIKQKVIFPSAVKYNISSDNIILADLIFRANFRVKKDPQDISIHKQVLKVYNSYKKPADEPAKMSLTMLLYILEVFRGDGRNAKKDLFLRMIDIRSNNFVSSQNAIKPFLNLIKTIFTKEEVIDFLINDAYKGHFWNNDLNKKNQTFCGLCLYYGLVSEWNRNSAGCMTCG